MSENLIKFLLVEDNDEHAKIVMRMLDKHQVPNEIKRVKDGQEALHYLWAKGKYSNRYLPDVILLDIKLPKLSGHEVLAKVKENSEMSKIPVIMVTTSDNDMDRNQAYASGVNSFLVKPIDANKFKSMISDFGLYWGWWNVLAPRGVESASQAS